MSDEDECSAAMADDASLSDLLSAQSAQIRALDDQLRLSADSRADENVLTQNRSIFVGDGDGDGSLATLAGAASAVANRRKHRRHRRTGRVLEGAVDASAHEASATIPLCVVPDDATLSSVAAAIESTLNGVLSRLHSEFSIADSTSSAQSSQSAIRPSVSSTVSVAPPPSGATASPARPASFVDARYRGSSDAQQSNAQRCTTPLLPTCVTSGSSTTTAVSALPLRNSNAEAFDSDLEENIYPADDSGRHGASNDLASDQGSRSNRKHVSTDEEPTRESELAAMWKTIRAAERKAVNAERAQARELNANSAWDQLYRRGDSSASASSSASTIPRRPVRLIDPHAMAASASATGPFPFLFPNSPDHALAIANGGKAKQRAAPPPPLIGVRGVGKINPAFVKQAVESFKPTETSVSDESATISSRSQHRTLPKSAAQSGVGGCGIASRRPGARVDRRRLLERAAAILLQDSDASDSESPVDADVGKTGWNAAPVPRGFDGEYSPMHTESISDGQSQVAAGSGSDFKDTNDDRVENAALHDMSDFYGSSSAELEATGADATAQNALFNDDAADMRLDSATNTQPFRGYGNGANFGEQRPAEANGTSVSSVSTEPFHSYSNMPLDPTYSSSSSLSTLPLSDSATASASPSLPSSSAAARTALPPPVRLDIPVRNVDSSLSSSSSVSALGNRRFQSSNALAMTGASFLPLPPRSLSASASSDQKSQHAPLASSQNHPPPNAQQSHRTGLGSGPLQKPPLRPASAALSRPAPPAPVDPRMPPASNAPFASASSATAAPAASLPSQARTSQHASAPPAQVAAVPRSSPAPNGTAWVIPAEPAAASNLEHRPSQSRQLQLSAPQQPSRQNQHADSHRQNRNPFQPPSSSSLSSSSSMASSSLHSRQQQPPQQHHSKLHPHSLGAIPSHATRVRTQAALAAEAAVASSYACANDDDDDF